MKDSTKSGKLSWRYHEDLELFSFLVIASFKITNSALKALWHVWHWLLHWWLGLWWDCCIVRSEGVRKGETILVFEILPFGTCICGLNSRIFRISELSKLKLWAKLHVVIYITHRKKALNDLVLEHMHHMVGLVICCICYD